MRVSKEFLKEYNKYKKKYGLPSLKEFYETLPTNLPKGNELPNRYLIFSMMGKLGGIADRLKSILYPSSVFKKVYAELKEEEIEEYKKLLEKVSLLLSKLELALYVDIDESFKIIKECYKEYCKLKKKKIIPFLKRISKAWEEVVKQKKKKERVKKEEKFYG